MAGTVEHIYVAAAEAAPPHAVTSVAAVAGRGLEGDRCQVGPADSPHDLCAITLVECEALDAALEELGIDVRQGRSRRQVHTRGVRLNELVGRAFTIGEVQCLGVELCEPCKHLESLTEAGVIRALVHRGGLRADILTDGVVAVGDAVYAI
jgi:MOSC domain-containing protein YiiM